MAILKNKTQGNFVMISRNITKNKKLGITERGLLLTLLSLYDGWNFSIEGICTILPDGKDKVTRSLNKLIELGYITKEQARDESGTFGCNIIEVHDIPVDDKGNPIPCAPPSDNRQTENLSSENKTQYNSINNTKLEDTKTKECEDTLPTYQYELLVKEYGKEAVDYQISRIKNKNYKGCMNLETIAQWCEERKTRKTVSIDKKSNKTEQDKSVAKCIDDALNAKGVWGGGK